MNIQGVGTTRSQMERSQSGRISGSGAGVNFANQLENAANTKPHTHIIYMKTDDMLYSGGNGTGLSFILNMRKIQPKMTRQLLQRGWMKMGMNLSRSYISTR